MGNPLDPHQWNVRLIALTETFVKISTAQFILYSFLATSVKLGILFLYRRLFWVRDSARYMIWIGMVTITLFYMAYLVTPVVHCFGSQLHMKVVLAVLFLTGLLWVFVSWSYVMVF
ncbi:hypothetical protein K504DRAFT_499449 [Pleomassaria siparia CBS 279.74]|uniref:Rhodopsin domain-containing protein n=1 Tax=Pleomassaria siparia CBS 279.74 TaxID=1314801 RepID=A0A6G1KHG3_9PLEO|nr:hypothetical protein K504DRAFT_499449 [Pleomassaria siparia CBS 279.74]